MYKINSVLKTIAIFFFISLITQHAVSQKWKINRLEKQIKKANDTKKIKILNQLAELYLDYSVDKSIKLANDGLKLNKKNSSSYRTEASFYNTLGAAYFLKKKYRKSIKYYNKEYKIIEKTKSSKRKIEALYNLATVYNRWGKNRNAKKYYLKSLDYAKKIKSKYLEMVIYKALYGFYNDRNKYKEALKYYKAYMSIKDINISKSTRRRISVLRSKYKTEKIKKEETEKELEIKDSLLTETEEENELLIIDTIQKSEKIVELNYEIEYEKQKLEIEKNKVLLKEAEIKQKQTIIFLIASVLSMIIIFSLWILRLYKQKIQANKILEQQKEEILSQSEELEYTNTILEEKNSQIIDSINYAKRIQDAILIPEEEIKLFLPELFIYYEPKDIVSGDFYWFSKIDEKYIIAAIDCTGHGVPGAFMSMIGNTLLNEIVNVKNITKPDIILSQLHIGVRNALQQNRKDSESEDGMDMSLCTIDKRNKRFQFAGAKNHIYVIQNDKLKVLKANYHSIGGRPLREDIEVSFSSYDFMFDENTTIYMLSDGYMDQFGGIDNTKFNTKRFKEMLLNNIELPMAKQKDVIKKTIHDWKGNTKQVDDILVMGVRL